MDIYSIDKVQRHLSFVILKLYCLSWELTLNSFKLLKVFKQQILFNMRKVN